MITIFNVKIVYATYQYYQNNEVYYNRKGILHTITAVMHECDDAIKINFPIINEYKTQMD